MTTTEPTQVPAPLGEIASLRTRVRGALHLPGEADYHALVTPWNLAVSVRPAAVLLAADAADVADCVRAAGEIGMRVAVQCTGHGAAADHAGTILISTRALDECTLHASERWARVGAGVKWKAVVDAAAPYGLAPLCGSTTDVGVVGYTTGGGTGPVARTYGLASDRVRALEVVTGDGLLRRVTPEDDPDLFWGLRGGKGVLGIVTAVEFDLVEQAEVFGGGLYFDGADAARVLRAWRDWSGTLPDSSTTSFAVLQLPALPGVPPPLAGRTTVAVRFTCTTGRCEGERLLAPMRRVAVPVLDGIDVLPYAAIDAVHADPVDPMAAVETSALLHALPDEALDVLLGATGSGSTSPQLLVEVRQLGGALARPGPHDSAYCHRDAAYQLFAVGVPTNPWVEAHGRLLVEAMGPWTTGARLPNFTATDDPAEFARCYTDEVLARLRRVSLTYDPTGVMAASQLVRQTVAPEVGLQLTNPVSGSCTVFRATAASTSGAYVEVQQTYRPHSRKPPMHLHPEQDEHFTVLSGLLHAVVGGVASDLHAGQVLQIPRGTPHRMWGAADEPTVVVWRTTPALRTDQLYCDLWSAAAQSNFRPDPVGAFEVALHYEAEFKLC